MPCPEESELERVARGELTEARGAEIVSHAAGCAACAARLADMRTWHHATTRTAVGGPRPRPLKSSELPPDTMLDHFCIIRPIGHGGMGSVYLARDTRLGRKVALKVLPARCGAPLDRWLEEARTTAQFNHPHIITIHEVGQDANLAYLALELLEGQTLRERLREAWLGVREVIRLGLAIARALTAAHAAGILHRDLKPENIYLPHDGRLRVLDFGLARATADVPEAERGLLMGTPAYMAPEQWRGEAITEAVDVWALGAILYEALAGRRPYAATAAAALEAEVCSPDPVAPLGQPERIPPPFAELVQRCLSKDPARRPAAAEVARHLEALVEERRPDAQECPFPGLAAFVEQQAGLFFGRENEIARFVERLRHQAVQPVVGPSGSGKSSFVLAGVIPRLREQGDWIVIHVRPGNDPLGHLCARLDELRASPSSPPFDPTLPPTVDERPARRDMVLEPRVTADLEGCTPQTLLRHPLALNMALAELARRTGSRVLLFVDQLEELHTLVDDAAVRRAAMEAICAAADDRQDPVRVVLTLRDDFLGRIAEGGGPVREALGQVTVLRGPDRDALREILTAPVERLGHAYEDAALVDEMIAEVEGEVASLPMLQSAARALWEARDVERRLLLRREYERLGGVGGALAAHADSVLDGLAPAALQLARAILVRLVTSEGTRQVLTSARLLDGLGPDAAPILRRLTEARLVTARRTSADDAAIVAEDSELELVHESLIARWQTLARWLDTSREERLFLAEVGQAAEHWQRHGEREEELWQGEPLDEALRASGRCRGPLPEGVRRFLDAGAVRRRRGRRRRLATVVAVAAALALAAGGSIYTLARKEREAVEARGRAETFSAQAQLESARFRLADGDPLAARAWLRGSLELAPSRAARKLWTRLREEPLLWRMVLGERITDISVAPDARTAVVAAEGWPLTLIDLERWTARRIGRPADKISRAAFSAYSRGVLATVDDSGRVELWQLPDRRAVLGEGKRWAQGIRVDREQVAVLMSQQICTWRVGQSGDGRCVRGMHAGLTRRGLLRADVSSDGLRIIEGDGSIVTSAPDTAMGMGFRLDGRQAAWTTGHQLVLAGLPGAPRRFPIDELPWIGPVYSGDGGRLAFALQPRPGERGGSIEIWDARAQRRLRRLPAREGKISALALSPDGELLLSGDWGGELTLYRVRAAGVTVGQLTRIAFSGGELVGAGVDGRLVFWDMDAGQPRHAFAAHRGKINALAGGPDGGLASVGDDGMLQLRTSTGGWPRSVLAHLGGANDLAFDPTGRVATGGADRFARVWDDRGRLRASIAHERPVVALGFDGAGRLATMDDRGKTAIHELRGETSKTLRGWDEGAGGPPALRFTPRGLLITGMSGVRLLPEPHLGERRPRLIQRCLGGCLRPATDPAGKLLALRTANSLCYPCGIVLVDLSAPRPARDGSRLNRSHVDRIYEREVLRLRGGKASIVDAAFSPDGKRLASLDSTGVRLWDARTGRQLWRGPLLALDPPRLFTHRGILALRERDRAPAAPARRWERAIVDGALLAREAGQRWLCLITDAHVELWDRTADRRVLRRAAPSAWDLVALDGGCLVAAGDGNLVLHAERGARPLEGRANAVGAADGQLLVAHKTRIRIHAADGRVARELPRPGSWPLGAVSGGGGLIVAGNGKGHVFVHEGGTWRSLVEEAVELARHRSHPVTRVLVGPARTVVVAFGSGEVAVLDLEGRDEVWRTRLYGAVEHLAADETRIYAASEIGDHLTIDLSPLLVPECALLGEVWKDTPYRWSGDQLLLTPPPANHRCAR